MRTLIDGEAKVLVGLRETTVVVQDRDGAKGETMWPDSFRARVAYDAAVLAHLEAGMREPASLPSLTGPPIDTPATFHTKTVGVPALRPFATGKRDTNAAIKALLAGQGPQLRERLAALPSFRIVPHLARLLREATEPLTTGQLDAAGRAERGRLLRRVATALSSHRDEPAAVTALDEVLASHPSRWVRASVGQGVCDARGPIEVLRHVAALLDVEPPWMDAHVYLMPAASSAVLVDPAGAYDRLSPYLSSDDSELPHRVLLLRSGHVLRAVSNHCQTIDARWWPAAAAFLLHGAYDLTSSARQLFAAAAADDAAVPDALVEQLASAVEEDELPALAALLEVATKRVIDDRLLPLVLRALERRLGHGAIHAELAVLEERGGDACVAEMRRLRDRAGDAEQRHALDGLIDQLAGSATPPSAALTARQEQDPIAGGLTSAGFSARRVTQLSALAQPTAILLPKKRRAIKTMGVSRIGGRPDMPDDTAWPRRADDQALPFIAQLDLAAVAQQDVGRLMAQRLPQSGMLWLFADDRFAVEATVDLVSDLLRAPCAVVYRSTPGPLSRRAWPRSLPDHCRHRPARLDVTVERRLPYHPSQIAHLGLTRKEQQRYHHHIEAAYHGGCQIFGYAECAYFLGLPPSAHELVFQLPSGWIADRALFFCAPLGACERGAFTDVFCLIDEL